MSREDDPGSQSFWVERGVAILGEAYDVHPWKEGRTFKRLQQNNLSRMRRRINRRMACYQMRATT